MNKTLNNGIYKLIKKIGEGGFGIVWLAQNTEDKTYCALKEIFPTSKESRELRALQNYQDKLRDKKIGNLIKVLDIFQEDGKTYYTMPLCDGSTKDPLDTNWMPITLETKIQAHKLVDSWFSAQKIVDIMIDIFSAVKELESTGLLHRDIKPSNILFINGKVCLGDIGLMANDSISVSSAGTPDYSAPSWYNSSPDMWGCATTCYAMLTGNNPDLMGRASYRWQPCGKGKMSQEEISQWISFHKIIARLTHEKPKERYRSCDDVIADLNKISARKKIRHYSDKKKYIIIFSLALTTLSLLVLQNYVPFNSNKASTITTISQELKTEEKTKEPIKSTPIQEIQTKEKTAEPIKSAPIQELKLASLTKKEKVELIKSMVDNLLKETDNTKIINTFNNIINVATNILPCIPSPSAEFGTTLWVLNPLYPKKTIYQITDKYLNAHIVLRKKDIAERIQQDIIEFKRQDNTLPTEEKLKNGIYVDRDEFQKYIKTFMDNFGKKTQDEQLSILKNKVIPLLRMTNLKAREFYSHLSNIYSPYNNKGAPNLIFDQILALKGKDAKVDEILCSKIKIKTLDFTKRSGRSKNIPKREKDVFYLWEVKR